jgi:hypothetical protein
VQAERCIPLIIREPFDEIHHGRELYGRRKVFKTFVKLGWNIVNHSVPEHTLYLIRRRVSLKTKSIPEEPDKKAQPLTQEVLSFAQLGSPNWTMFELFS